MTNAFNERAVIGANNPPVDPFEALKVNADDLIEQVRTITIVSTADQLKAVDDLADHLRDAAKALEDERVARKKPLDDQIAEIQATFNVYLAPLINKTVKGKIPLALDALKKAKEPYLKEQERLRQEAALEAQRKAQEAADAAAAAARAAAPEDMEAREDVELQVSAAQAAQRDAVRAANAASRGSGLRTYWIPTLDDPMAALKHFMATRPDDLKSWLLEMARQQIAAGVRTIPGVIVTEERRAA
ncbi:MAG: hypothetical protein J7521_20170 [Caulobacter sp.]|nr:hypothetical protein [Caulobacter sp.]